MPRALPYLQFQCTIGAYGKSRHLRFFERFFDGGGFAVFVGEHFYDHAGKLADERRQQQNAQHGKERVEHGHHGLGMMPPHESVESMDQGNDYGEQPKHDERGDQVEHDVGGGGALGLNACADDGQNGSSPWCRCSPR